MALVLFSYLPMTVLSSCTVVSPVINTCDPSYRLVEQFLTWSKENRMSCNLSKCKELIFRKKNNSVQYQPINNIPQCSNLVLLGVTLQSNCKFSAHARLKLNKANKCLHSLRTLRKEQYSQKKNRSSVYIFGVTEFYLWSTCLFLSYNFPIV